MRGILLYTGTKYSQQDSLLWLIFACPFEKRMFYLLQTDLNKVAADANSAGSYFPIALQILFAVGLIGFLMTVTHMLGPKRQTPGLTQQSWHAPLPVRSRPLRYPGLACWIRGRDRAWQTASELPEPMYRTPRSVPRQKRPSPH